jgi:hypothetical protein
VVRALDGGEAGPAFLPETHHDFGTIRQGVTARHGFVIRNRGDRPLVIERLEFSRPGMTARFPAAVPAGGEGTITVSWDTSQARGQVESEAVANLGDPTQARVRLVLTAIVKPGVEVLPYPAVFVSVFAGDSAERSLVIVNNDEQPLTITGVEAAGPHCRARVETEETGKRYRIIVVVPAGVPAGRYREQVFVETDHPERSRLTIPVNVFVKAEVYANPEAVDFGVVPLAHLAKEPGVLQLLTQTVMVKKRAGPFAIEKISSDLVSVDVRQTPAARSSAFRLDVGLVRQRLRPGPIAGTIRVTTDDAEFPEILIPVRGELK